uniref:Uncharacterized protein n=1 Tax=Panagrolaimus sp. JU765 TaxID=591449 RepID=A0AC34RMQ6_9BILA
MWGEALMIIPVIEQGATSVNGYLPGSSTWYSVYDSYYGTKVTPGNVSHPAPLTSLIPLFVRGGYILPRQSPAMTTIYSRKNRFELLIAFTSEDTPTSNGELYWDDGESLFDDISNHNYYHFTFFSQLSSTNFILQINKIRSANGIILPKLENIELFGYKFYPNLKNATLNGNPVYFDDPNGSYSPFTQVLNVTATGMIDLNNGSSWTLTWSNTVDF